MLGPSACLRPKPKPGLGLGLGNLDCVVRLNLKHLRCCRGQFKVSASIGLMLILATIYSTACVCGFRAFEFIVGAAVDLVVGPSG